MPQDAGDTPGIGEAAAHRFGEFGDPDIVRTRRQEQKPGRRGQLGGEMGELAIAAQRRRGRALRAGKRRRVGDHDVEALSGGGERGRFAEHIAPAKGAAFGDAVAPGRLRRKRESRLGAVDAEHRGSALVRRGDGEPAAVAIEVEHPRILRQPRNEAAIVALVEEPAGLLPGQHISHEHRAVFLDRHRPRDAAQRHPGFQRQPFLGSRRAVVAQHDCLRREEAAQRLRDDRNEPVHPGGVCFDHQDRAKPVDDETGEAVRLGMDEPVIGRIVQPLAQLERALQPAREETLVDRPPGIAVEEAGGDQAVRVEHRDAERALIRPAQGDERPGRERFRRRIHHHLVRVDPRVAALGPAMKAWQQGDLRPPRRVVGLGRDSGHLRDRVNFRHAACPSRLRVSEDAGRACRAKLMDYRTSARIDSVRGRL